MSMMIIYPGFKTQAWIDALHGIDPSLKIEVWPEIEDNSAVEFALCWNQPPDLLRQFPNLKCISSLGAGVNHLLDDPTRPTSVPLVRLVDRDLQQGMAEYVLTGVLEHFRQFRYYRAQQSNKEWRPRPNRHISEVGIGIMGMGQIGEFVGRKLQGIGFRVHGWRRTPQPVEGMEVLSGQSALPDFLRRADILVCLLPLTPETENILNARTFAALQPGAYLINVARGRHLVEEDLLAALDSGRLSGALLDVFREEPLPEQHPFWSHAKIMLTPHVASVTNPRSAAQQVIENYRRAQQGAPLLNRVDASSGY
jgi:glyoxylate/hydroxypyruvate reductase A